MPSLTRGGIKIQEFPRANSNHDIFFCDCELCQKIGMRISLSLCCHCALWFQGLNAALLFLVWCSSNIFCTSLWSSRSPGLGLLHTFFFNTLVTGFGFSFFFSHTWVGSIRQPGRVSCLALFEFPAFFFSMAIFSMWFCHTSLGTGKGVVLEEEEDGDSVVVSRFSWRYSSAELEILAASRFHQFEFPALFWNSLAALLADLLARVLTCRLRDFLTGWQTRWGR